MKLAHSLPGFNAAIAPPHQPITVLRQQIAPLLLRRTKGSTDVDGKPIVVLPPRTVRTIYLQLSDEERDFYTKLHSRSRAEFLSYGVNASYTSVLALLLRLRQCCDHPFLVLSRSDTGNTLGAVEKHLGGGTGASRAAAVLERVKQQGSSGSGSSEGAEATEEGAAEEQNRDECPVCLEPPDDAVITPCAHSFCRECILGVLGHKTSVECPMCRKPLTRESLLTLPRANRFCVDLDNQWRSSAKVDALMHSLCDGLQEEEDAAAAMEEAEDDDDDEDDDDRPPPPPPLKSVVFSQWTAMLDLVEAALKREPKFAPGSGRYGYTRLDGGMSADERMKALKRFRDDKSMRVFLMSLKTGGVGLNLTAARRVYLLDPWFNPATEEQAMDRVHRLGQEQPVIATRFIVRGTVEEKMLKLQDSKRALCQAALVEGPADANLSAAARRAQKEKEKELRLKDLAYCFAE